MLYNNRALTCLKLGLNQRALQDADWAIRLNRMSVKGTIYKAEALYNLGKFRESEETIKEACENLPAKAKFFQGKHLLYSNKILSVLNEIRHIKVSY